MAGFSELTVNGLGSNQSTLKEALKSLKQEKPSSEQSSDFMDHMKASIQEVNQLQKTADQQALELSTGKSESLHETMLALTKAELSFNLMVQVRNRALEAYQEVMRMPV